MFCCWPRRISIFKSAPLLFIIKCFGLPYFLSKPSPTQWDVAPVAASGSAPPWYCHGSTAVRYRTTGASTGPCVHLQHDVVTVDEPVKRCVLDTVLLLFVLPSGAPYLYQSVGTGSWMLLCGVHVFRVLIAAVGSSECA